MLQDQFERIATEASKLARYSKKPTISSREIQVASNKFSVMYLKAEAAMSVLCIRMIYGVELGCTALADSGAADPAWGAGQACRERGMGAWWRCSSE